MPGSNGFTKMRARTDEVRGGPFNVCTCLEADSAALTVRGSSLPGGSCRRINANAFCESESMDDTGIALAFYAENYELLGQWQLKPGKRVFLGEREPRICRFCGKSKPQVTFNLKAHALPELLGNKSLFSLYECDECNSFFGSGIENDFGNWSKPMRSLQRIRGKGGVPTLKSDDDGWRIEWDRDRQFNVNHARGDTVFTVSETEKRVTFLLRRDPHVPIAVLKAFVKMGLSVVPEAELSNFARALQWIRNPKHRMEFDLLAPVHRSFIPGPSAPDFISVAVLRRNDKDATLPYAFLLLSAANETFQVMLPSPERDPAPGGPARSMPPFPPVRTPYGPAGYSALDLSGTETVVNDRVSVEMTFEQVIATGLPGTDEASGETGPGSEVVDRPASL